MSNDSSCSEDESLPIPSKANDLMDRLQSEARVIRNNYSKRLALDALDSTTWNVTFKGPYHKPYNGVTLTLQFLFTSEYPKYAPHVHFL